MKYLNIAVMANRTVKIATEGQYNATMTRIDALMKKGEKNLTDQEASELDSLVTAAEEYELSIYTIPAPTTLEGIIELKMFERKLKQKDLAQLMKIGESKLSRILSGKRPVDVEFLKAAHDTLGIDGNTLLEYA